MAVTNKKNNQTNSVTEDQECLAGVRPSLEDLLRSAHEAAELDTPDDGFDSKVTFNAPKKDAKAATTSSGHASHFPRAASGKIR